MFYFKTEEEMHKFLLSILILQSLFVVKGSEFFDSPVSNIIGCFGKTQVTLIVSDYYKNIIPLINNVMDLLSESPCFDLYIFINNLQKAVLWRDGRDLFEANFRKSQFSFSRSGYRIPDIPESIMTNIVTAEVIQGESFVKKTCSKQILLYPVYSIGDKSDVLKALECFDNKKDRYVILICTVCPKIQSIPFSRTISSFNIGPMQLINLIRNPNFNRREYIKHVKLDDDERLKCLKNGKNIHIVVYKPSIVLLENIAILVRNTQGSLTNFTYYYYYRNDYANRFFDHYGIKDFKNFKIISTYYSNNLKIIESFEQKSDDIYLFYYIKKEILDHIFLSRNIVKDRKNVIIYDDGNTKYIDVLFRRYRLTKFQESSRHQIQDMNQIRKEFLEEVLENSCF